MTSFVGNQFYAIGAGSASDSVLYPVLSIENPTTADVNYPIYKRWINTVSGDELMLIATPLNNGILTATWLLLSFGASTLATLTGDSGGIITPVANNITLAGGNNISTVGTPGIITFSVTGTTNHSVLIGNSSGSLTSVANGTTGQVLTAVTGADPIWTAGGGSAVETINANSGSATPVANAVTINGGTTGLTTTASGSTVSLTGILIPANGGTGNANTGTSGQILIGDGTKYVSSAPTSGTGIVVGLGAGTMTVSTSALLTAPTSSGTATVSSNAITFTGASGITTSASGSTVTITGSGGTVTAISVATANGFAGSSSGGATPALTLSTTITGVLTGNGTAISGSAVTNHGVVIGAASNAVSTTSVGATGTVLIGNTGADPTFSATPSVTSITIANAPSAGTDGANKAYVDLIAAGFEFKTLCYAASTTALTVTYSNGTAGVGATLTNATTQSAFSIDGTSPPSGSRILIKDQVSTFQNGIYTVTTVGSGASDWVLTRATDYDQAAEIQAGDLIPVQNGTVNSSTFWVETATVVTIGTDPITFISFGSEGIVTIAGSAGTPISGDNVTISPGTTGLIYTGSGSTLTTSGTLVAGNGGTGLTSPGTSGNLLVSNGSAWTSAGAAASGGSLVLVSSQVPNNSASIIFTSLTQTNYLLIITETVPTNSTGVLRLEVSQDNGSTYVSAGYASGITYNPYNATTATNTSSSSLFLLSGPSANGSGTPISARINLYTGSGFVFQILGESFWFDTTLSNYAVGTVGGLCTATSVNAIRITSSTGNLSGQFINLYYYKNS
ncbi:MAG: hypothetical protein V4708_17105 [Bacteroidota bacterium]